MTLYGSRGLFSFFVGIFPVEKHVIDFWQDFRVERDGPGLEEGETGYLCVHLPPVAYQLLQRDFTA